MRSVTATLAVQRFTLAADALVADSSTVTSRPTSAPRPCLTSSARAASASTSRLSADDRLPGRLDRPPRDRRDRDGGGRGQLEAARRPRL